MVDYNDGKIHGWNGGDCPVHPKTRVEVWLRGYGGDTGFEASIYEWQHLGPYNNSDIIAFRVIKQYVEPKTIWVNEYRSGHVAYDTKEEADKNAGYHAIRKAVKYVEVQK